MVTLSRTMPDNPGKGEPAREGIAERGARLTNIVKDGENRKHIGRGRDLAMCETVAGKMAGHSTARQLDGWYEMSLAPKDGHLLLLVFDSGELRPYVGQWNDDGGGGWVVRLPMNSSRSTVIPKRWAPLPDFPPFIR
jgi:hypothetical protein